MSTTEDGRPRRAIEAQAGVMLVADFNPEHTRIEAVRLLPAGGVAVTLGWDVVDSLRELFATESLSVDKSAPEDV